MFVTTCLLSLIMFSTTLIRHRTTSLTLTLCQSTIFQNQKLWFSIFFFPILSNQNYWYNLNASVLMRALYQGTYAPKTESNILIYLALHNIRRNNQNKYYNLMGVMRCLKTSSHVIELQNICWWSKTLFDLV